ncbi:MAG: GNAT family N-acetyltransferase [Bacillota bacterium]
MYYREMYFFDKERPVKGTIRSYTKGDFSGLIDIQREAFPPPFPPELWWDEEQLSNHVGFFPEGALCAEIAGELAGSMTGLIVDLAEDDIHHTWAEITDEGYIRNHNLRGNTLYVVDICVKPSYRKLGIGKWLMHAMYEVVVHKGLKRLLGGGRIPGYHLVSEKMNAADYLRAVIKGEMQDPVVSFLLRCGRMPIAIVPNYLDDKESCNYGVLMEWRNPFIFR